MEVPINDLGSLLFPAILVAIVVPGRIRAASGLRRVLLVIALIVASTFITAGGADYKDYSRDRVEVDNLLLMATLVSVLYLVGATVVWIRSRGVDREDGRLLESH